MSRCPSEMCMTCANWKRAGLHGTCLKPTALVHDDESIHPRAHTNTSETFWAEWCEIYVWKNAKK